MKVKQYIKVTGLNALNIEVSFIIMEVLIRDISLYYVHFLEHKVWYVETSYS